MTPLRLPAPVKINLFLHILGRRSDGYHELQTIFQLLDAGDELSFALRTDGDVQLQCADPSLCAADNLVIRAARQLQWHTDTANGVDITLQKNMPIGGGLGGGSSDAATTLLALNSLWQVHLPEKELMSIGSALGADVPVFIKGQTAWAEGVGERLQTVELPEVWYVVLTPELQVSTATIFAHPELTRDSAAITVAAFFEQGIPTQYKGLASESILRNDCQPLVAKLYPKVAEVIDWLRQFAPALMTGTGASVFAPFESETDARKVMEKSPWPGFVARGINRSPVHALLRDD